MSNRFDLLFLDEDGAPVVQAVTKKAVPQAAAEKKTASAGKTSSPAKKDGRMEGERKEKDAGANRSQGRPQQITSATELADRPERSAHRGGRRPAASNGSLDRHSRSGRKHEGEKRQYSGKGNWGNPTDATEAVAEANVATEETVAAASEETAEAVEEVPVASPFMTLGQFMAEQEKKKPAVAAPAARAANDGAKVTGEVVKKTDDMFFITPKGAAKAAAASAAAGKKQEKSTTSGATKFSLQELNAVIPGGLARPPRPVREETEQRRGGRNNTTARRNAELPTAPVKKAFINTKDEASFPSL